MTEAQFLEQTDKEFETIALGLDAVLEKATDESWQATRPDNGWTTAQVLEHICRSILPCEAPVAQALAKAQPGDGAVGLVKYFPKLFRWLYAKRVPVPDALEIKELIPKDIALNHWSQCKALVRSEIQQSQGRHISRAKFRNPIVPLFQTSVAAYLAVTVEHIRHHAEQIHQRV